jgi:Fic family protein
VTDNQTKIINQLLAAIDSQKEVLDSRHPLTTEQVLRIKRVYDVDLTYNSNAIEGSTMTFNETKLVLNEGLTIGGKRLSEHLEIINHRDAIDFIEQVSSHQIGVSIKDIKDIHYLILKGIDNKYAGTFRDRPVGVRRSDGTIYHFTDPLLINDAIGIFINALKQNEQHPILRAATAHFDFVTIHPFIDGNGRTARLLMNLILLQYGYPPAIIRMVNKVNYILAIETAQNEHNLYDFYTVVANAVAESIASYLVMLDMDVI